MITRTVILPFSLPNDDLEVLKNTISLYTKSYLYCIDVGWEMEKISSVKLHNATYKYLKEKLKLKSQYLCSSRNRALETIKSLRKLKRNNKKNSKPSGQRLIPIRLDTRTFSFDKTKEYVSVTTQQKRLFIPLIWHKQALKYKSWNCQAGEIGFDKKGKTVLRLVFSLEKPVLERTNKVIGIDRGIKHAAVSSDNRFIGKSKDKEHEKKLLLLKAKLQSKGTKSAKRHLKKLSGRLRRFKENVDRLVAKEILSDLNPGDTIVLEDLTNIKKHCGEKGKVRKKHRIHMGRWSYKRLEKAISYSAQVQGVYIDFLKPNYTSQECSRCHIILKRNRKTQSFYSCNCGLKLNADLNAARTLVNRWYNAISIMHGPAVNWPNVADLKSSYKPLTLVRGN
jgi:IS605 OrfB family transposase